MRMETPDFAQLGPPPLEHRDLLFLFEHFPVPGVDAVTAAQQVLERPSTLESLLESRYVQQALDDRTWLDVSPRLYFGVQLRRLLPGPRSALDRRTLHYLANLLEIFVRADRLQAVQPDEMRRYEYLVDLVMAMADERTERRFLMEAQLANQALFISGIWGRWIVSRHRDRRRLLSLDYYRAMGCSYYAQAARETPAKALGLQEIFTHLARRFDYFRLGLERLAEQCLPRRGSAAIH